MNFDRSFGLKNKKGIFLAYDHGFEHYPDKDFVNVKSADPLTILNIVYENDLNGVVLTPGIIKKYAKDIKDRDLRVIVKVNSKTKMAEEQYYSSLTISDLDTLLLCCDNILGVGYTIYFGSSYEQHMISEFARLRDMADDYGLYTFVWAYPRGKNISKDNDVRLISYSARVAMELGADAVKIKAPDNIEDIKNIKSYLHRTRLFIAGGEKSNNFINIAEKAIKYADGMIVGRNLWKDPDNAKYIISRMKSFI